MKEEENKTMIPLTYDREFVSIFGIDDNIILTERMISILLKLDIKDVRGNLKIQKRNLRLQNHKSRQNQIDLLLDYKGEKINIELQRYYSEAIKERNVVYASKIHGEQLKKGEKYKNIESFIQIVLNADEAHMSNEFIEEIELYNLTKKERFSNKFKIKIINLPKYKNSCYNEDEEIVNFSKLMLSKTYEELETSLRSMKMEEEEKELLESSVEEFSSDLEEIAIYMDRSKEELEYEAVMEDRMNESLEEGKQEGIKLGIKEGEKNKTIEIAKNMLKKDIDIETIIEITGLTKEEILVLKN